MRSVLSVWNVKRAGVSHHKRSIYTVSFHTPHYVNRTITSNASSTFFPPLHVTEFFVMQHIVEDERSDREETDDSEDEDKAQESERRPKTKNGPLQNGYSASNNNHRKMEWWGERGWAEV